MVVSRCPEEGVRNPRPRIAGEVVSAYNSGDRVVVRPMGDLLANSNTIYFLPFRPKGGRPMGDTFYLKADLRLLADDFSQIIPYFCQSADFIN